MTRYNETYRRALLDMHIPDWDPAFLSQYDPVALADEYARSGVEAVLFYCKSHMGLSYWPTPVGGIHPAAKDRDLVGELHAALTERGIRPAAYHSVTFDNWAYEKHPDWQQKNAVTRRGEPNIPAMGGRYGTLCMNNPEYLAYEVEQIQALLSRYEFDAIWIDMVFWTTVCTCQYCEEKCQTELGHAIPAVIDWSDPAWNNFQEARARWRDEFWVKIRKAIWETRPEIAVTHNLAPELYGWVLGGTTDEVPSDTFAAGDLYGGRDQQLMVSRLMHAINRVPPAEFMTSRSPHLGYHVQLRSERELLVQALGATSQHLAFLFIDAIDPVGTTQPGTYDRIGSVFEQIRDYQPYLGGSPVSDVAVYFSPRNKVTDTQNGTPLEFGFPIRNPYDEAFDGALLGLQAAHIPFTVLTRTTLDQLSRYPVLVLPHVARLTDEEIAIFRQYVETGGRLYASGLTSVKRSDGSRRSDFGLADVFGVHANADYEGIVVFAKPQTAEIADVISPEAYVSWGLPVELEIGMRPTTPLDIPLVADPEPDTEVLATISLPYAYPALGTVEAHDFASIHSSPPWTDTEWPAVVRRSAGQGSVVYSSVPFESAGDVSSRSLFTSLIEGLVGEAPRLTADAAPTVWVTLFDQPEKNRMILSVLNYDKVGGLTATVTATVRPPVGYHATSVRRTTDASPVGGVDIRDGVVTLSGLHVELFEQFAIEIAAVVA